MAVTDVQVRKLMEELKKGDGLEVAALRSGMDRKTARKYRDKAKFPSELSPVRGYRTRGDPFGEIWPVMVLRLADAPELEAKTLFEELLETQPGKYEPGQLRTLQRRVRDWRAQQGPEKEIFFSQLHRPGEAMQTDFTWGTELQITIARESFAHLLCHPVLPYSNWEWATVCQSESMAAIRRGVQAALFQLGRVPAFHQTDNSTAATHHIPEKAPAVGVETSERRRPFNQEYLALMRHLGMEPRTIEVGESNQNGDVEALNGALKRRLKQHLLVRGSCDFESVPAYEAWVQQVITKANLTRTKRIVEDLAAMRPLAVDRLPEYRQEEVGVTAWSTIRIKDNAYSVPSRLIGERVQVRVYEDRLEVLHRQKPQLTVERLRGNNGHCINYRHIIWSLVQKPGAFARYRYREELFPHLAFRRAYDSLQKLSPRKADLEYLRILHLAASTMEAEVVVALELLLASGGVSAAEQVKALVSPGRSEVPHLAAPEVDLRGYDKLLTESLEVAS